MIIDCHGCQPPGLACGDCAAQAIISEHEQPPDLGPAELRALRVLASAGMIAPLRYSPRAAKASLILASVPEIPITKLANRLKLTSGSY
jgi:hypothetical protein